MGIHGCPGQLPFTRIHLLQDGRGQLHQEPDAGFVWQHEERRFGHEMLNRAIDLQQGLLLVIPWASFVPSTMMKGDGITQLYIAHLNQVLEHNIIPK